MGYDSTVTGTLTSLNDAVTIDTEGRANVGFQVEHSGFTGTITFEAHSGDGWTPIFGFLAGTGRTHTSWTNPDTGVVFRCTVAGFTEIRCRLSSVGAGSLNIYAIASAATSGVFLNFPLPEGQNLIGAVSDQIYNIEQTGFLNSKIASNITIHGYRRQWANTTGLNDLCAYLVGGQAKMNTPAVGTTYYINSTSAQDATGGTGVDRVTIYYLNSANVMQSVTASLNGTTAVSIGSGFTFFQYMESYHSTTADRVAIGNITISSINGVATEATTMEMIQAGIDISRSGRFKIPTGYHAHLTDFHFSSVKITGGGSCQFEPSGGVTNMGLTSN